MADKGADKAARVAADRRKLQSAYDFIGRDGNRWRALPDGTFVRLVPADTQIATPLRLIGEPERAPVIREKP